MLAKSLDKTANIELFSYELKKEINSDYELKKCYFQALSNSSWATKGYLVAFEIDSGLKEEIARLNNAFGIGVILLKANPFESVALFEAKTNSLDFRTIDKFCNINGDFCWFISKVESVLSVDSKHYEAVLKDLVSSCDRPFDKD